MCSNLRVRLVALSFLWSVILRHRGNTGTIHGVVLHCKVFMTSKSKSSAARHVVSSYDIRSFYVILVCDETACHYCIKCSFCSRCCAHSTKPGIGWSPNISRLKPRDGSLDSAYKLATGDDLKTWVQSLIPM